jgi:hemerythrin
LGDISAVSFIIPLFITLFSEFGYYLIRAWQQDERQNYYKNRNSIMSSKSYSNTVQWDDSFSIGIKAIDDQHKTLLQMANDLVTSVLCHDKSQGIYLQIIIRKLIVFVQHHLYTEEMLMKTIGYPSLSEHREKHEEFLNKILNLNKIKTGAYDEPDKLANLLHDWALSHITTMDSQFGKFFVQRQITGQS